MTISSWQQRKLDRYNAALDEARRFVFKAEEAKVEITECTSQMRQAAAKRASMDLSRSLSVLRSSLY